MEETIITERPLIKILDRIGQLIVLGVCWILGSLPVITLGTSTTALYYAVMKSVRRERGYSLGEFWKSYRANLGRGILATVPMLLLAGLLCLNIWTLCLAAGKNGTLIVGNVLLLVLLALTWVYVCPILSRFTMRLRDVWKLAFVMALRFFPGAAAVLAGTAVLAALHIWVLPIAAVALTPGLWCFATTYLIEKALRRYMPEKPKDDNAWYYE